MKRAVLYLRVSTLDQTTANQERELRQVAERAGWQIGHVYKDQGVSGAKGRDKRPAFDALHKAAVRREFDVVMAWSVDRLGRSLQDLVGFLSEIHAAGVDLFLHQQGLDTTTPGGKAMFQMLGVFAEFERSIIQERVRAGLRRAVSARASSLGVRGRTPHQRGSKRARRHATAGARSFPSVPFLSIPFPSAGAHTSGVLCAPVTRGSRVALASSCCKGRGVCPGDGRSLSASRLLIT